jgi:hypothetical protein
LIDYVFLRMTEYPATKPPVPTKRATFTSIRVKLSNALLRVLLVCILSYLKLVLKYKFLTFHTYYPDTLHFREQGYGNPWLFLENKRHLRAKKFGNTAL